MMIMFKSRRRKVAIKLLTRQLDEINSLEITNYNSWKSYTDAIIKQYIDEKFIKESEIMGLTFEIDFEDNDDKRSANKIAKDWLLMKKYLAKDYVGRCLRYLEDGGELIHIPNWFCRRTVGEILSMIAIFQAILLGSVLPFTCNQGKIQGAVDSKTEIGKLKHERDSLGFELINCISNLPKPNDSPKDKPAKDKD